MKTFGTLNLTFAFAVMGMLVASTHSAQADFSYRNRNNSINCDNYSSGGPSGDTIFGCNLQNGSTSGDYSSSYSCNTFFLDHGVCNINFNNNRDCSAYQGDCTIVFKCSDGKTYSCDINNWDGCTQIKCYDLPQDCQRDCQDIYICKPHDTPPCSSVPEPSTILAGALLLIPFGISTMRKMIFKSNQSSQQR